MWQLALVLMAAAAGLYSARVQGLNLANALLISGSYCFGVGESDFAQRLCNRIGRAGLRKIGLASSALALALIVPFWFYRGPLLFAGIGIATVVAFTCEFLMFWND